MTYFKYCILSLFIFFSVAGKSQMLLLNGRYTGKNVYVQNPAVGDSGKFCTDSIRINKTILKNISFTNAYEVALDTLNFSIGDTVEIIIYHKEDCKPKIIHSEHGGKPTFNITEISVDSTGLLKWATLQEEGKLIYQVQQFIWNKWMLVGEVGGKGDPFKNEYEFQTTLHSGKNTFRIGQEGIGNSRKFPESISIVSEKEKINYTIIENQIIFSGETRYEIYDSSGNLIKRGFASEVEVQFLKTGTYYLNYDSSSTHFSKH